MPFYYSLQEIIMQYVTAILFGLIKGTLNFIPQKHMDIVKQFEHLFSVSVSTDDITTITSVSLYLRQKGLKFDKYLTSGKSHQISIGECSFVHFHEGHPFFFTFTKAKTSDHFHNFEIKTVKGNEKAIFDFLQHVRDLESRSQLRGLCVKQLNRNRYRAEWMYACKLHQRSIDSICLNKEHKDAIRNAIDRYNANYGKTNIFGLPNKLVIMLSGPVGSGKSSLINAIASELKRSLYYAGPDVLYNDNLTEAIQMAKNNIVVTEEIELVFGRDVVEEDDDAQDERPLKRRVGRRKNIAQVVGFSNCINIMDGILTPNDLIWIITSNDVDALDARLVRKSRVDLHLTIDYCNARALLDFACYIYDQPLLLPFGMENMRFLGTDVYETYNAHPNDPFAFFAKMASLNKTD